MFCLVEAVCVACFNAALAIWTIPCWAILMILLGVIKCCPQSYQPSLRERFSWFSILLSSVAWRIAMLLCCWVRIRCDGREEFGAEMDKNPRKPRVMLSNHLSFLDALLASIVFPIRHVGEVRMLVSEHLFRFYFLGGMLRAMKHVCIPFKSQGENDFQVDREVLPVLMKQIEDWVMAGHIGSWFPEGQTNRGDPTILQPYRAGGFGICVRNDLEIWCNVYAGNGVCWPRTQPVGGFPAKIHQKVFKICESSHDFLREASLPADADEKAKCFWMANRVQDLCQARLNEINQEGWASNTGEEARLIDSKLPK